MHAWSSHPRSDKLFLTHALWIFWIKEGIVTPSGSKRHITAYLIRQFRFGLAIKLSCIQTKLTGNGFHSISLEDKSITSAESTSSYLKSISCWLTATSWWLVYFKAHHGHTLTISRRVLICKVCWSQVKIATLSFTALDHFRPTWRERILVLDQD